MYPNLEAEFKRQNIKREDIATLLGINLSTVPDKLNSENRLKLCEAIKIKNAWFPNLSLDYLFANFAD